jgi:hypothetical protein
MGRRGDEDRGTLSSFAFGMLSVMGVHDVATPLTRSLYLSFLLTGLAVAQSAPKPAAPQLSPQAAYDEVMQPLEITRRVISNWSDSEMKALGIAVEQATSACQARTPEQFNGDDLIAFGRLCALGQQWPIVGSVATRYITSSDPAKPLLAQAYAYQIGADLHISSPKTILADSQAMLHAVPYTSLTDETLYGALHYLQLAFMPEALTLYAEREPLVLQALQTPQPSSPVSPDADVPVHALYADGVSFAALQQFAGEPQAAAKTIADLDAALPAALQPDDSIPIDGTRRQYALLGTHLPQIPLSVSLFRVGESPRINTNYGAATVLFLFPDWCAQCIRIAQQMMPTLSRMNGEENRIHLYALLAQPTPPAVAAPKPAGKPRPATSATKLPPEPEAPKTAAEQLRGTPTLVVTSQTLSQFAATDFPLLIAVDPKGMIRFIQPAGENALNPGDFVDQIAAHIEKQWPVGSNRASNSAAIPSKP